ncbi:hypothetical protein V9T40_005813 [Parthenolecanium corni]|uniref:Glucose-methanol-choline oxidoreductase N-terminal domain-containing protein n=1 Tax=Parthenolecanium corni TaxID=536013 RepID=A0AAN9TTJ0_9HEMI
MESLSHSCPNMGSIGVAQLMFTQLITTLTNSYCDLNPTYPPDQSSRVLSGDEKYDFIIVGAGSAGSTIAARLSEVDHWNILLIEAGQDPPLESNIPALIPIIINTTYDWNFKTEKSKKACRSSKNGQCLWPKGKMLGGSSSINGMFYIRGFAQDYDNWRELGNPGWGYKDVLKYFKKLEKIHAKNSDKEFHGYEGAVAVEEFSETILSNFLPFEKIIKDAASELGLPEQQDFAASMKSGSITLWGTVKNGSRASTAKSYLVPARDRKNLIIMKEALVTKLLIDNKKLVYGVEVLKNGELRNITCTKEVILSAGAINSPKIMMLSGLGPREHLTEHGIPIIADLKVGYNLQDHIMVINSYIKSNIQSPQSGKHDAFYNYLTRRTELGSLRAIMIFIDTLKNTTDFPDIQYHIFNNILLSKPSLIDTTGPNEEFMNWIEGIRELNDIAGIYPTLLRPKSTGRVLLRSANFIDSPKLVSGYLEHEDDVKTLIRGIRFLEKLMKTDALKNASLLMGSAEECNHFEGDSDLRYECYIRNFAVTVYHVAGSCKMGPKEDLEAVVDPLLKVYHVKGLRVADSSIMPKIVSGNTNVPTIMIGEKAADLIKAEWLK